MKFEWAYLVIGILVLVVLVSGCIKSPIEKGDVIITTDKTEYLQGEAIEITIKNKLNISLTNHENSNDNLKGTPFYNQPVGWGFIERLENKDWIKIEPLWRCGERCWEKCDLSYWFFVLGPGGTANFPKDSISFEWNQTQLICDLNLSNIRREFVGTGIFRVSSTFLDESKNTLETFYSDEFEIKKLECSTDSDCEGGAMKNDEGEIVWGCSLKGNIIPTSGKIPPKCACINDTCIKIGDGMSYCELNCKNMGFESGKCLKTSPTLPNATCEDRYNMIALNNLIAISGNVCPLEEVNQHELLNILPEESIACCCNE